MQSNNLDNNINIETKKHKPKLSEGNYIALAAIVFILLQIIMMIHRHFAEDNIDRNIPSKNIVLSMQAEDPALLSQVTLVSAPIMKLENIELGLIGAEFGVISKEIGNGFINETSYEKTIKNAALSGFYTGADFFGDLKEDALLALYFRANSLGIERKRDAIKANLNIKVTDDQGEKCRVCYNYYEDKFLEIDNYTYGVVMVSAFSDSKQFTININSLELVLDVEKIFKQRNE